MGIVGYEFGFGYRSSTSLCFDSEKVTFGDFSKKPYVEVKHISKKI